MKTTDEIAGQTSPLQAYPNPMKRHPAAPTRQNSVESRIYSSSGSGAASTTGSRITDT